ncbi:glucokinase [Tepiditoga spiralis]|uniref:Glucokinase n=1 Tax=Tepiditoga spiralis TaxID=2108365 RepID=A0A7G1G407_9BACT|nr:ROK family protein [Tepiditoga spiralis]BBE31198.1 glucokinase [Tepiditoga spiralis]
MRIAGIDLGGTEIKAGLVNESGILKKVSTSTEVEKGSEKIVENIVKTIKMLGEKVEAIGIGSPGSIDRKNGIVRYSPNFPQWHDFELGKKVYELTGKKVFIENDANAFTLGEWYYGNAKGCNDFICLTFGTGVGSGVVINKKMLFGKDGIGAELGHIIVSSDGPMCGCGNRGCLESYASAKSVARMAKELVLKHNNSSLLNRVKDINEIESKHVFEEAKNGDFISKYVVEKITDLIAKAISGYIHIFNPEKIILGGGMSKAGNELLNPIIEKTDMYVMKSFKNTYKIELSNLVEDAGILGAASCAIYGMEE